MKGSRVAQRVKTSLLGLQERVERSFEGIATRGAPDNFSTRKGRESTQEIKLRDGYIYIACSTRFRDEDLYSGIDSLSSTKEKKRKKERKSLGRNILAKLIEFLIRSTTNYVSHWPLT